MNKKTIFTTVFAFAILVANAQIKVWTGGKTYMGNTSTIPLSQLSVGGAGNSLFQIYGYNSTTNTAGTNAIRGEHATPTSSVTVYSVAGIITPGAYGTSVGMVGASYKATTVAGRTYGVYGYAGNGESGYNYGTYGLLLGSRNGAAVYGSINGPSATGGYYAGYFDGAILTNSVAFKPGGGSWTSISDERLKTAITPFLDGMDVINQINPIKYKYTGTGGMPTESYYYGVKAQDLQEIAPYTVGYITLVANQSETGTFNVIEHLTPDSSGNEKVIIEALSFNHDALIYVMINALKEEKQKSDDLEGRVAELDALVRNCCAASAPKSLNIIEEDGTQQNQNLRNGNSRENTTQVIELSYSDNAILYQNIPNPFGDETTINYYLPQSVNSAKIVFYNDMGQKIKEVNLEHKNNASLNIKTSELAQGIYSYSLEVDGKVAETKKMLKNK